MPKLTVKKLAYKTGTLNSLNKISLTEEIYYYKREYYHNTGGIMEYVLIERYTGCTFGGLD